MKRKIKAAEEAIDDVFSDTSVSIHATLEAMENLRDGIEFKIQSLKSDIKRKQEA